MAGADCQLQEGGGGPSAGLSTLTATKPARKVVDRRGRGMPQRSQIDSLLVLHREHSISSQEYPPFTAWSIVGDGSTGPPSAHIFSFQYSQSSLSACLMRASPLARASNDCEPRIRTGLAELLAECLSVAPGKRRWMVLRGHSPCLVERRPAATLFVTPRTMCTGIVQ